MKTKLIVALSLVALTLSLILASSHIQGDEAPVRRAADNQVQGVATETNCTLEGTLRIHPKFLDKYYLADFGGGQSCALFGLEKFKEVKPGSTIEVTGELRTRFHAGGSEKNPSPFPKTWIIYMNVETLRVTREPEPTLSQPNPKVQSGK